MQSEWSVLIKRYRFQFGLTQHGMGQMLGVSQKTVSRWESGENRPSPIQQQQFNDLLRVPDDSVSAGLKAAVAFSPALRGLARYNNLNLLAVSKATAARRPSIVDWIGRNLAPIACGVLGQMLDDHALQRSIVQGEIACVSAVVRNNLMTSDLPAPGTLRSVFSFYFIDSTLIFDAISAPAADDEPLGYWPVAFDEIVNL